MFTQGSLILEVAKLQRLEALQFTKNMDHSKTSMNKVPDSDVLIQEHRTPQNGKQAPIGVNVNLNVNWNLKRCLTSNWCPISVLSVMVVSAVVFFVLHFFVFGFLKSRVQEGLIIRNRDAWVHPEAEMYLRCFIFNLTNSDHIADDNTVGVEEIGPYVYRIGVERTDITWNANHTVSYRMNLTFTFDPEQSVGAEEDIVTTVNMPTVALQAKTGSFGSWALNGMFSLKGELFHTFIVKKLLWGFVSEDFKKLNSKLGLFHLTVPTEFGYFLHLNNTPGAMFNVYTGDYNFTKFNEINSWNNFKTLPYWPSEWASAVRGTDGSMFQPFSDRDSKMTVFIPSLLRSFDLEFLKEVKSQGVACLRYIIPDSEFSNATMSGKEKQPVAQSNVETAVNSKDLNHTGPGSVKTPTETGQSTAEGDFCSPNCLPNGMYSVEAAAEGVPIMMSLPHLLGADPVYSKHIHGLSPREPAHRPRFDVDEVTGVVVDQRRRYQVNVKLPKSASDDLRTFVPLFWVEEAITINEETASLIRETHVGVVVTSVLRYFVLALSVLAWLLLIIILVVRGCTDTDPKEKGYQVLST